MSDRILSIYNNLADVPDDFLGTARVENTNYLIVITASTVGGTIVRNSTGYGPLADRPSATLFGVGTWQDGLDIYVSDGAEYLQVGSAGGGGGGGDISTNLIATLIDGTPLVVPIADGAFVLPITIWAKPRNSDTITVDSSFDDGVTWEPAWIVTTINWNDTLLAGVTHIRFTRSAGTGILSTVGIV